MAAPTEAIPRFDKDAFNKHYADAAASQGEVIAGAFATMQAHMDVRFDRLEGIVAEIREGVTELRKGQAELREGMAALVRRDA